MVSGGRAVESLIIKIPWNFGDWRLRRMAFAYCLVCWIRLCKLSVFCLESMFAFSSISHFFTDACGTACPGVFGPRVRSIFFGFLWASASMHATDRFTLFLLFTNFYSFYI